MTTTITIPAYKIMNTTENTASLDITAEIETAFRILIRDHGSTTKALDRVSDAWVTSNWASVSHYADHRLLYSLKARGVEWLVKAFYSLA